VSVDGIYMMSPFLLRLSLFKNPYFIGFGENPTCPTPPPSPKSLLTRFNERDNMAKICYILRGLPGSGKSMLAENLASGGKGSRLGIFSTDDLFMVDGEYQFDPSKLAQNHAYNLRNATQFMESFKLPNQNINCIIDNTNTQHWEYEKYVEVAKKNGFMVQIITVEWNINDIPLYAERNSHGVPEEAIYRMAERWEYPSLDNVSIRV
jgi:tRNA uridine 5-carbamoylmethylation protein Kti12